MSTSTTLRAFVRARSANNNVPPSLAEVAAELGVNRETTRIRLQECVASGLMSWEPGKARSYQLTDAGLRILGGSVTFR